MKTTLLDVVKSYFAKDKGRYWYDHYADEDKELRRMDASELARVIDESSLPGGSKTKRIFAEHLLAIELARIQARPAWFAIWAGLIGLVVGAYLNSVLPMLLSMGNQEAGGNHGASIQKPEAQPIIQGVSSAVAVSPPSRDTVQNANQSGTKSNR